MLVHSVENQGICLEAGNEAVSWSITEFAEAISFLKTFPLLLYKLLLEWGDSGDPCPPPD